MELRQGTARDASALARILIDARRAAGPQFPPAVHADHELQPYLLADVLPRAEVWLAEDSGRAIGGLVLEHDEGGGMPRRLPDLIGQLSVLPSAQGAGVGSALLAHAKRRRPAGLDLWVFASNTRARAFYRRHAFTVVGGTGDANEERAPDLLMRWLP